ncbi:PTS glucose transporter subunit IIA [Flavonifractor sp. An92]|uniref:PTS sugar transporter subunit IIA n=1 Tax=Flavonifractor sp. An92 TaxID=1965666 RepID=UPI000B39C928|nr:MULTISPECIES: PTS glucose transporter subunit IIA [unclassified Flavonifractor]OUN05565.1 PTS glucose transporter subunit IIA [Flavonifractor sp. An92]OUQ24147.1 PTS glucose transporter subunit IIA [Flavonifractor sp. An135]
MFFGKKKNVAPVEPQLVAPMTGEYINIAQVPDPVFSKKVLGDGVAVMPTEGLVVAPISGKIISIADTKHAFGLQADGLDILIHIGLNTVELAGDGFEPLVKVGQTVSVGDPICRVDLNLIRSQGYALYTPVVITNIDAVKELTTHTGSGTAGQTVVLEYTK